MLRMVALQGISSEAYFIPYEGQDLLTYFSTSVSLHLTFCTVFIT